MSLHCKIAISVRGRALAGWFPVAVFVATAGIFFLCAHQASAQETLSNVISSAPSPVGSGARAAGIGYAFIAVADDATAASWNPAGLVQLERPEVSLVGSFYFLSDDLGSTPNVWPGWSFTGDTAQSSSVNLNFASFVFPFTLLERNISASLSYQRKLDFNRKLDFTLVHDLSSEQEQMDFTHRIAFKQKGGLATLSPGLAAQVIPSLSVGAVANLWIPELGRSYSWRREHAIHVTTRFQDTVENELWIHSTNTFDLRRGVSATFGVLWAATKGLSLGAFYTLGFSTDVTRVKESEKGAQMSSYRLKYPQSYGFGVCYRFTDRFMITADYTRVEWDEFELRDESGQAINVVGDIKGPLGRVDATNTVRVGAEYLWIREKFVVPFRAGGFYDPQPKTGAPVSYFGFSLGSGLSLRDITVDLAYQLRVGLDDREAAILKLVVGWSEPGGTVAVDTYQNLLLLSMVYRFR